MAREPVSDTSVDEVVTGGSAPVPSAVESPSRHATVVWLPLTPSFVRPSTHGRGPRTRQLPSSAPRWICTPLIDAYDEG